MTENNDKITLSYYPSPFVNLKIIKSGVPLFLPPDRGNVKINGKTFVNCWFIILVFIVYFYLQYLNPFSGYLKTYNK